MAAVVHIERLTGGPASASDVTSINTRLNAEDTHTTAGTSNPVSIPASGTKYSYWASTRVNVISGLGGTLNNLRWFTSGSLGTGVGIIAQDAGGYIQATGVAGDSGDQLTTTSYSTLTGAPVNALTFTSGSPKSVPGSTATTGPVGNLMVYQFTVGSTAAPGVTSSITITWRYDET